MADFLGLVAACLTTASFVPQAILVIRTRNTDGLSLYMYLLFTTGIAFWLVYGVMIGSLPIIIANLITVVLASMILTVKLMNTISARRAIIRPR
ncbi:MAG TPA: glutathione synthetase [Henriciella marina]|uniref:SemiSWEET transporter n=1 Tax=Henriciella sp. TaxID=1968823 RepID=UPI00182123F6|nr:SemiSWEET transporter [Henriciella sp.]HIG21629.1 glutathione synthetase [Henriciella sp.]HIK63832.1 glutathione synthetase [Henriciella marina]